MNRGHHTIVLLVAALISSAGCIDYLDSGELGRARYFGEVRGAAPLRMSPPISDREGNVYALYGERGLNEAAAFIGHARGGWSTGCEIHEGDDRGAHGWVGHATRRAWYWSGDALVAVNGETGGCSAVLDRDPRSGSNLLFQAVVPMVVEQPSRSTVITMIQTSADPVPYHAVVDLDLGRYSEGRQFEPSGASDVRVLGVGADEPSRTGFIVVRYSFEGRTEVEGLFLDHEGRITARAPITGASGSTEDAVEGYLQSVDGDIVIGLLETGELIMFDRNAGSTVPFDAFAAAGVHKWNDRLYVVGGTAAGPQIATISERGEIGEPQPWQSSLEAAAALSADTIAVIDERSEPRQVVGWQSPSSAIGAAPFLSAHSPDPYATDTTGWLVAGPAFQLETNPRTSVAFAPIGITYP